MTPIGIALRRVFTQFTIEIDANPDLAGNEVVAMSRLRNHFLLAADLYRETQDVFHFSTRFDYADLISSRSVLLNPSLPPLSRDDVDISGHFYEQINELRTRIDRARDDEPLPLGPERETGYVLLNQVTRMYCEGRDFRRCGEVVQRRVTEGQCQQAMA